MIIIIEHDNKAVVEEVTNFTIHRGPENASVEFTNPYRKNVDLDVGDSVTIVVPGHEDIKYIIKLPSFLRRNPIEPEDWITRHCDHQTLIQKFQVTAVDVSDERVHTHQGWVTFEQLATINGEPVK